MKIKNPQGRHCTVPAGFVYVILNCPWQLGAVFEDK